MQDEDIKKYFNLVKRIEQLKLDKELRVIERPLSSDLQKSLSKKNACSEIPEKKESPDGWECE